MALRDCDRAWTVCNVLCPSNSTAGLPPDHRVIVAVFDGPTSKIKVGTHPIVEGPTGVSVSGRNVLGSQGTTLATAGLVGGYAFIRAYDRALNNSDIEAASIELHRAYAIS